MDLNFGTDPESLKHELSSNIKQFFGSFSNYEDSKWEIYANALIQKIEDDNFTFFKTPDFVIELLSECGIALNSDEEINSAILQQINELASLYCHTKVKNYTREQEYIEDARLNSNPFKFLK